MLIVNADDLGRDKVATDSILECFGHGRIASTSAMVFMADSERAAELASESGIDLGLHLNFSEQFTGPNVPPKLQSAHGRICRFLKRSKYALLVYNPLLRKEFRYIYEAQQAEFERLYGRKPSHYDGHQHMHLATNVLIGRLIPEGTKVRRSFSFRSGEKSVFNRMYRAAVDRSLARRHTLTDYFFSIAHYMTPDRLKHVVDLAEHSNVELMTHPALPDEFEYLMGEAYQMVSATAKTGSYSALNAR